MTQIRKLEDNAQNQFYPQTHTRAVVDDNGNSVENILQHQLDVIQQNQMGIGAVPSDLSPTEGSSNWVTSGGVFDATNTGQNIAVDTSLYTAVRAFINPNNNWVCTDNNYPYYGKFIPVIPNLRYKIVAQSENSAYYAFLTSDSYSQGSSVSYATGCTRQSIQYGTYSIDTAPSNAAYLWIATYTNKDIEPQSVVQYNKKSIVEIISDVDEIPIENSEKLITSGGVYEATSYFTSYTTPSYSLTSGSYITTGGSVSSSANFSITSVIPVQQGQTVKCTASYQAQIAIIALSNSSGTSFTPVAIPQSSSSSIQRETFSYTATENGYIVCSGRTGSGETIDVLVSEKTEISTIVDTVMNPDTTPIEDSGNLITSGGVYDSLQVPQYELFDTSGLTKYDYALKSNGKWTSSTSTKHLIVELSEDVHYIRLSCSGGSNGAFFGFLQSSSASSGGTPSYATGSSVMWATDNKTYVKEKPSTALYLCLNAVDSNSHSVNWHIEMSDENISVREAVEKLDEDIELLNTSTSMSNFSHNMTLDFKFDTNTNTAYTVIRVFKDTLEGQTFVPRVNYVGPSTYSAKELAIYAGYELTINCGLGRLTGGTVEGVLIQDGVVINNNLPQDHIGVMPLTINSNGVLGYASADADADTLVSNGIVQAFCGFAPLIVDYVDFNDTSAYQSVNHYNQPAQRQILGQYNNGDYAIVTCEGRDYDNSTGWTIPQCKTICKNIGLKFAYNCDGGASTQTVVGKKQLNTWYSRKICTYLYFKTT